MTAATMTERQEAIEKIDSMIQEIEIAMLTTRAETGLLRSRPMVSVTRRFDGDLWFFSHSQDSRMGDIHAHPRVGVVFARPKSKSYLSLSGEAAEVVDRRKFESLWKPELAEWFPDGVETEGLVLIQVKVDHAEFWDHRRVTMVELLKAVVGGDEIARTTHEEITWPDSVTPK
ncbi:general stress protein [bacterium]|nr:general stress protein [bacterium]